MNNRTVSIVAIVLFLLTLIATIFLWTRNNKLQQSNETYIAEVDSLTNVKYELLGEIDSIQGAFERMSFRSDSLSGSLAKAEKTIDELNRVRRKSAADLESLRNEINQLRSLKGDLEATVAQLQEENERLTVENEQLTVQLVESETRNQELTSMTQDLQEANQVLLDEMNRLKAASVKANGFQVDILRGSGKATISGRRADIIETSFDITEVPREYQGLHTVYLVISDANGTPIQSLNPVRARLTVNNEVAEIEAQQAKEVNLTTSQRLSFKHEIQERRLNPGYYRVAIYSDMGFLGSAGFQLK